MYKDGPFRTFQNLSEDLASLVGLGNDFAVEFAASRSSIQGFSNEIKVSPDSRPVQHVALVEVESLLNWSIVQDAEDISIPPGTDRGLQSALPRADPIKMNHSEEFLKDLMNAKLEWHFNFKRFSRRYSNRCTGQNES